MNQIEKLKNELERRLSELPVGNIAVHGNLESHFRRAELISMRNFIESMEKEPQDMGEVSDGYHTFNELYYYRMLYNAAFFNLLPKGWAHKSKRHHTGEECFGGEWFIVMANLPTGQVSNHYELKDWDLFKVTEKEIADEWDGHTPQEAAERIKKYLQLPDTLEDKIKRATESWKGVDVDEFMDEVRGREQEQPDKYETALEKAREWMPNVNEGGHAILIDIFPELGEGLDPRYGGRKQEQPDVQNGKFVFPKYLYARSKDNKTIDMSYAPQDMTAVEYIRNDFVEQEQPEVDLVKFTEKVDDFKARYKHPEIVSIKGAMAFMARMFYQYPNVARQWYDSLPKATMD